MNGNFFGKDLSGSGGPTLLKNGRIIDPANHRDEVGDLLIVGGRIANLSDLKGMENPPR